MQLAALYYEMQAEALERNVEKRETFDDRVSRMQLEKGSDGWAVVQ